MKKIILLIGITLCGFTGNLLSAAPSQDKIRTDNNDIREWAVKWENQARELKHQVRLYSLVTAPLTNDSDDAAGRNGTKGKAEKALSTFLKTLGGLKGSIEDLKKTVSKK